MHPAHGFMRGKCLTGCGALLWLICLMALGWPISVAAHGGGSSGSQAGIPIPSLTHGEMAVIDPYYRRIVALAAAATDTDETFRRVLNFAQIQRSYCLWGVMPGGISDEESPFNECSHAYLAAAKAVLLRMRTMKDEMVAAGDLVSKSTLISCATICRSFFAASAAKASTPPISSGQDFRTLSCMPRAWQRSCWRYWQWRSACGGPRVLCGQNRLRQNRRYPPQLDGGVSVYQSRRRSRQPSRSHRSRWGRWP